MSFNNKHFSCMTAKTKTVNLTYFAIRICRTKQKMTFLCVSIGVQ